MIGSVRPGRLRFRGELVDQFLVLVVDGAHQAGPGDLAEGGDHGRVVDAGEATASYS